MVNTLMEADWQLLLDRIKTDQCIPFLGAGTCSGVLPLASDIASRWAQEYDYPLADRSLMSVAQYLAVIYDARFPKERIKDWFDGIASPDLTSGNEPHRVLASLQLPLYITTNYDDYMARALAARPNRRDVRREFCRWHSGLHDLPRAFDVNFVPSSANPIVYHLHGHTGETDSLVLTEDDYLEFLASMVRQVELLPPPIDAMLRRYTCLFIGYGLADWNFRVLFQSLRNRLSARNFAVLPPPGETAEQQQRAQDYLDEKFREFNLKVYWGTAREFCTELQTHCPAP